MHGRRNPLHQSQDLVHTRSLEVSMKWYTCSGVEESHFLIGDISRELNRLRRKWRDL